MCPRAVSISPTNFHINFHKDIFLSYHADRQTYTQAHKFMKT
jgi:hypothetical protein